MFTNASHALCAALGPGFSNAQEQAKPQIPLKPLPPGGGAAL